jgi:hypothetical protein
VFRCLTGQELVRRPGNPVQRGTRPTAGARTRRGPRSDPGCVDDSRAGHTRESKRRDATSWGRSLGSDASVHGGAEAVPWSQAPGVSSGRSCCEHLRNLQRPVTSSSCRSGKRPRCRSDRPPRWVALPTVPFASCRSEIRAAADCRLPEQVDVRRCRFVRAPRRPGASTAGVSGFHEGSGHADGSLKNRLRADVTEATGSATRAGIR